MLFARFYGVTLFVCLFLLSMGVAGAETLESGDEGQEVKDVQVRLSSLGYGIDVDGNFGPSTAEAVRKFQAAYDMEVDGVIGQTTYQALMGRAMPVSRSDNTTSKARRLISMAMRHQGTPYVFGGKSPGGFDCSGFVYYTFAQMGVSLPRMADEQYYAGRSISQGSLRAGDLVFFSTYTEGISHVGIYLGNRQFVHASSSRGVTIDSLDSDYYSSAYVAACRVL